MKSSVLNTREKNRDYLMDNMKAVMLFLVAFGHVLDVYKSDGSIELYLMKYIYLFHMPLFAFITGYFSKNVDRARVGAVEKCLVPYVLFQGVYVIIANIMIGVGAASFNSNVFNGSLLIPSSAFYYLLAVFFWKLLAKDIVRTRYSLIVSVILGVIISLTKMEEFHIGYGAIFSLLPFFVMGVLCGQDWVNKIRKIPKIVAVLILVLGILPAVYLPYSIHSVRMTYASVGFGAIEGICYRLVFYLIATAMGVAIICLMDGKESRLSQIGKASILVYAGSTFLAPHAYVIVDKVFHLSNSGVVNLIGMSVFCLAIIIICSLPIFLKWYNTVVVTINRYIFKEQ